MGWSFIEYAGHSEPFKDFDLWTLRHFFIEEANALESAHPSNETRWLREFFEQWDWLGNGVFIGTKLSEYVAGARPRWELLLQLMQNAGDRISTFGEFIPLDYLTAHVSTKMAYFTKAQPTRPYLLCIGRICTLLGRHEPEPA